MLAHLVLMHMHDQQHLVALDNQFNHNFSLFIVRLSILNTLTLYGVLSAKTKTYLIPLS
jgi:hypothetical protein